MIDKEKAQMIEAQKRFFELLAKITPCEFEEESGRIILRGKETQDEIASLLRTSGSTFGRLLKPIDDVDGPKTEKPYRNASEKIIKFLKAREEGRDDTFNLDTGDFSPGFSIREKMLLTIIGLLVLVTSFSVLSSQEKKVPFQGDLDWEGIDKILRLSGTGVAYEFGVITCRENDLKIRRQSVLSREDSIEFLGDMQDLVRQQISVGREAYDHPVFMTKAGVNIYGLLSMISPPNQLFGCTPLETYLANPNSFPECAKDYDKGLISLKDDLLSKDKNILSILSTVAAEVGGVQANQLDSLKNRYHSLINE